MAKSMLDLDIKTLLIQNKGSSKASEELKEAINGYDIYERIVQMLAMRGLKQKDFLSSLGITRQNLARWKSGSLPSVDVLYEIKEKLQVSIDWLLTGKNEIDPIEKINGTLKYLEREFDEFSKAMKEQLVCIENSLAKTSGTVVVEEKSKESEENENKKW